MKWILFIMTLIIFQGCFFKKHYPELPSFNMLLIDSTTVLNTKDIPEGEPFVFIYFSPDCHDCQNETAMIIKSIKVLEKTKLYFITNDPFDRLQLFQKVYRTNNYQNIVLARDYEIAFPKLYQTTGTPFSVIYDKNKQLRGVFRGEASINTMIQIIDKLWKE